jgi:hypothetical protein
MAAHKCVMLQPALFVIVAYHTAQQRCRRQPAIAVLRCQLQATTRVTHIARGIIMQNGPQCRPSLHGWACITFWAYHPLRIVCEVGVHLYTLTTGRWHPTAAYHLPALWQTVQPFLKIVKFDNSLVLPRLLSPINTILLTPTITQCIYCAKFTRV